MVYSGLKFGMLLQFAIGPMCLMVFNTSVKEGFPAGLTLVIAIALIDGLYIALSGIGIAAFINKSSVKLAIKIFGSIVLILFGVNTILGVLNYSLLPVIALFTAVSGMNIFLQGLLLTASNPLTIIFWSGVFSAKVVEKGLNKKQLFLFGLGCVLSTLLFLTAVALCGDILGIFLPNIVIKILNIAVGMLLIYFGIKLLLRK